MRSYIVFELQIVDTTVHLMAIYEFSKQISFAIINGSSKVHPTALESFQDFGITRTNPHERIRQIPFLPHD